MVLLPRLAFAFATLALGLLLPACGPAASGKPSKFPPREEGCAVQVFPDAPRVQSENLGPVSARCDLDISAEDCLRTLKDQVCKAGGDVVWGVDKPTVIDGKQRLSGRAAHTRAAKK